MQEKPKIAFICTHNSCRSQIAEALAKKYLSTKYEIYSAGTEIKNYINPDAVRLMKVHYDIDMEKEQKPKTIESLPLPIDHVVTMGCGVQCPFLPAKKREDWGLEDPTGKSDEEFLAIIQEIENKILTLNEEKKA